MYKTLGTMVREYGTKNWINTKDNYQKNSVRQVYYFSMEYLLGRLLHSNLSNLGVLNICQKGLEDLGFSLKEIEQQEVDAALGNGGLGRLAACLLDSMASCQLPGNGFGVRYKYGLFEQKIIDGYQVELPDNWLKDANIWEFKRPEISYEIKFGGKINSSSDGNRMYFEQVDYDAVVAVAYDIPIFGFENNTVNNLRLWSAEPSEKKLASCCEYPSAIVAITYKNYKDSAESITEYLYPDDSLREGKILRLKQEYFLVSAGVQNICRNHKKLYGSLHTLHTKVAIHINDTHPAVAIPELMRILLDEEGMTWGEAWHITINTFSYTNHTIMAEALEKWPEELFKTLLPRIYMLVQEINERFCSSLWNLYPGDWEKISKMSIISYGQVQMAHLAVVGSHCVNGVSKIHTELLKNEEMKNFNQVYPKKFGNITNGITHRRWLIEANPTLAELITESVGNDWIKQPSYLINLLKFTKDTCFLDKLAEIKNQNKIKLANYIWESNGIKVDPTSIFDVQIKRLHLYKRQLLNVLHIMDLYNQLLEKPSLDIVPRTFIFAAKSAPGYLLSKKIIKLINTVAKRVNNDKSIEGKIKIVFLENYRVSLAENIIPASDVSEQISTATKEASGTGNMKLMMNGAVTVGTLDGANIEIKEYVGNENIFIFGLKPEEVLNYYYYGGYSSMDIYNSNNRIKKVLDQLVNGFLSTFENEFEMIRHFLLTNNDEFFVMRDFEAYLEAQAKVNSCYQDRRRWQEMSITNIAHSGKFSSDRTITEYAKFIWRINPIA